MMAIVVEAPYLKDSGDGTIHEPVKEISMP